MGRTISSIARSFEIRRQDGGRAVCAHAARVRAGVAFANALVVLRRGETDGCLAVDEREQARFLALQEFLDDHRPVARGRDRGLRLLASHRDGHALSSGQAVGLDHDRHAELVERVVSGGRSFNAHVPGGGIPFAAQRSLVNPWSPRAGRPQRSDRTLQNRPRAVRRQPGHERSLRPDDDEFDVRFSRQLGHCRGIAGIDVDAFRQRAMPGLPGAASSLSQLGDCLSRQASASSRPPDPKQDIHGSPRRQRRQPVSRGQGRRQRACAVRHRTVDVAQAHYRNVLRPCSRPGRDFRLQAARFGTLLLQPEGRRRLHGRRRLAKLGAALAFRPEDGAEVIATGKLTTYPGRSNYQIMVDRLELAGEGALMALLDKRRRALAAEGLFDASRKRKLPFLPRAIGVVTSPTGAVIRDILHRLEDRCPTHVIVWPVAGAGRGRIDESGPGHTRLRRASAGGPVPRPDLLIVARGGGSIEDLWAFNEEEVVRAAAELLDPANFRRWA